MINTAKSVAVLGCILLAACGQQDTRDPAPVKSGESARAAPPAAFAMCASCHPVSPSRHGAGPSLAGVWGAKAGSRPDYGYSPALQRSGIVWDARTLDRWLQGPMQMVPGTRMVVGLPNPEARQAVIAYLQQLQ